MYISFDDNENEAIDDIYVLTSALEDILVHIPEALSPEPLCKVAGVLVRGIADGAAELKN